MNPNIKTLELPAQEHLHQQYEYRDGELYRKYLCRGRRISDPIGVVGRYGYKRMSIPLASGTRYFHIHRIIFLYHHGYLPDRIDHIDGDKLNNRIENLRPCTNAQNMMNLRPTEKGSSRFKGVCLVKVTGNWQAAIKVEGRLKHLGTYTSEEDAAMAYNEAASIYFGEYSWGNVSPLNNQEVV